MADIILFGSGAFAARIALDIAASAQAPVRLCIAGRNASRVDWLRTAGNARAAIFGTKVRFTAAPVDLSGGEDAAELIARLRPAVVVQAASAQTASVISSSGNAWTRLVTEGGLSATAVLQAMFTLRVARAMRLAGSDAVLVNACFPDVVNGLLVAAGFPVACGVGNVAILSNAFAAAVDRFEPGAVRVLAHYQTIGVFRQPVAERRGPVPRVWIDGEEVGDVLTQFRDVKITPEPAIEISGASGVPLILAMAHWQPWRGHVPGPHGWPGGYPVRWTGHEMVADLPAGLSLDEAIQWNARFEEASGLLIGENGQARYCGTLYELLRTESPALATGFNVAELDQVFAEMDALRARMLQRR
jgi:hypothetical protein